MKIIELKELFKYDYSIQNVLAHMHYWPDGSSWSTPADGRINNGLMYFTDCAVDYYANGVYKLSANRGEIAFLPKRSRYTCRFRNCSQYDIDSKNIIVENYYLEGVKSRIQDNKVRINAIFIGFELFDNTREPFTLTEDISVFRLAESKLFMEKFKQMALMSRYGSIPPAKLNIAAYEILTELSMELYKWSEIQNGYNKIEPSLLYLSSNDISTINIPDLASVCGLSESGFRKRFKKIMGITPIEYINEMKIKKAKSLLELCELTVKQVAYETGFIDEFYFSRFYKKMTGKTPSEVINEKRYHLFTGG